MGFLSRVVDGGRDGVTEAAIKLAEVIASKSPIAVIGTKARLRALDGVADRSQYLLTASRDLSVADGLALTTAWARRALPTSLVLTRVEYGRTAVE